MFCGDWLFGCFGFRGGEEKGVNCFAVFFLPFQYNNRKMPDRFKDVEYNHQDLEADLNLRLILDFLKNLLAKFNP